MRRAIVMGGKSHTIIFYLYLTSEGKDLETARVGQHRFVPVHELLDPTLLRYQLVAGSKIEMVSIAQNYLSAGLGNILYIKRFDSGLRTYGHENWRLDSTMRRGETTRSGLANGFFESKGKAVHAWYYIILPMLTIDQFDYSLPHRFIAQKPAEPRDGSKLLVVNRESGEMEHHHFYELPSLLGPNDVIVRNNTKVVPARIFGQKNTGGQVELLLTKRLHLEDAQEVWECLTKPGLKPDQVVTFENSALVATCQEITGYTRQIAFNLSHAALFEELTKIGHTPIPPYITEWTDDDEQQLRQLYQTTFAKIQGSAAAPTAGLHFTPHIDEVLRKKGVQIEEITLHVGLGTFLSVKTEDIALHEMHSEWFTLPEAVAQRLNKAKQREKRIIAVGTTSTRVLETCAKDGQLVPQTGETQLYVYPPRKFEFVDAMLTNFHEPKTTLIMLVSAFSSAPNTNHEFEHFMNTTVGKTYQAAMDNNYRFLSFGDAMLIE